MSKEKADNIFHQFNPSKKDGKAKVSEIDETSKSLYVVVNVGKMSRDGGGGWYVELGIEPRACQH